MKLTQKQINFTQDYFKEIPPGQAYMTHYKVKSMSVAKACASRLLTKANVQAYIEELRLKSETATVMTRQEILERHSEIARARLGDFIDTDGELVKIDKDSLNSAALQELKTTQFTGGKDGRASSKTTTIELRDPVRSMQEIAKLQGHYPKEDTNITYNDIKVLIVREQPREALESKPSHEIEGNSKE